jgi:hypothetical protein
MIGAVERFHVDANLRDQDSRHQSIHSGNGHQQAMLLPIGVELLVDPLVEFGHFLFDRFDAAQLHTQ